MNTSFDQKLERTSGMFWLKDVFTPDRNRETGLLSYAGAEFEFPTCPVLRRGIAQAAEASMFGYTLARGKYLACIQWWMQTVRGCAIEPDWVVSTHGTIFSLATTIRMQTEPGENIIMLTPGYTRYEQAATRLGRGTVRVPLKDEDGCYSMDWDALETAMAQVHNRVLVLCNPNNPTGNVYTRTEIERIAVLAEKYGVTVFSDEIFADVVFGDPVTPYAAVAGENALAITCTSLGKTFSLTGMNHANLIIKNEMLREKFIAQRNADHYGSLDPLHAAALTAAYTPEGYAWLQELRSYVQENMRIVTAFMKEYFPGAVVTQPEGTFVLWVDFAPAGMSGRDVQALIVEKGCFAGDPGEEYLDREACMRFALAVPRGELERSLRYLAQAISG